MNHLWEEIKSVDTSRKALRSFGLVVGGIFVAIVAFSLWRRGFDVATWHRVLGGLGGALVVLGAVAPRVLLPAYRLWMGLAVVLGFIMTRVILTAMYYLVFTPIALVLRLTGRDPMQRRLDSAAPSYWVEKVYTDDSPKRLTKYY